MKYLMIGLVGIMMVVSVGCVAHNSISPVDSRVIMAPNIGYDVYVRDIRCAKGNSEFLTVQANVVNNRKRPVLVDWKVTWLDADGIEIESVVSTWNSIALQPMDVRGLKSTAPRSDASDMRIYIRKGR